MRAYKVSCDYVVEIDGDDDTVSTEDRTAFAYAGTQADATATRRQFMEAYDVKLKDVEIQETDIPTDKTGLLAFINSLINND